MDILTLENVTRKLLIVYSKSFTVLVPFLPSLTLFARTMIEFARNISSYFLPAPLVPPKVVIAWAAGNEVIVKM